jgi:hypothetical protein
MDVHARAVHAEDRLRHEGRVQTVIHRDLLHDETEGRDAVGGRHGVGVLEVDLVLSGGDLVVGGLDFEAHLLQGENDVAARLFPAVDRRQVEVGPFVVGVHDRIAGGVPTEEEEFGLWSGDHRVAERRGLVHLLLQRHARAAGERAPIRVVHIADQTPDLLAALVRPGIDRERREVGDQVHVGFLDPREAFDRGAVELDLAVQSLLELRAGISTFLMTPRMSVNWSLMKRTFSASQTFRISALVRPGPAASNFRTFAFGILTSVFCRMREILQSRMRISSTFVPDSARNLAQLHSFLCIFLNRARGTASGGLRLSGSPRRSALKTSPPRPAGKPLTVSQPDFAGRAKKPR